MRTSVLHTVLVVAMGAGLASCAGKDALDTNFYDLTYLGRGANVTPVPAAGWVATDSLATATATVTGNPADSTVHVVYTVSTAPTGTIDSVLIFTANSSASLNSALVLPTVVLCNSAATCDGDVTSAKVATFPALWTSARGYGTQLVFVTTTHPKSAGGAIRGVPYPTP
jgi:hypothetical protein